MKRKFLLFLMIAVLFVVSLAGCDDYNTNTEPSINESTQATSEPSTEATLNINELTYPQYNALSPEEQQTVVNSFDTVEEFIQWYDEEKQFYEEFQDKIHGNTTIESTDVTIGTETVETTETIDGTEGTFPVESKPETNSVTFLEYHSMTGVQQKEFINNFESIEAFMEWHAKARQAYLDSMTEIDGTTPIDLGELVGTTEGSN